MLIKINVCHKVYIMHKGEAAYIIELCLYKKYYLNKLYIFNVVYSWMKHQLSLYIILPLLWQP